MAAKASDNIDVVFSLNLDMPASPESSDEKFCHWNFVPRQD